MQQCYIVSACRTPIGKFQGGLSALTAPQLGAVAIREALARAGVEGAQIDEVIMGCVLQAGLGQNPARQASLGAGVPDTVGAFTINKVCGSGLKAVALACQAIRAGDAELIVAGGMESMTNAPYLLPDARMGQRLGHGRVLDAMVHDGLWEAYEDFHMGITGELVAEKYGVTREMQDTFAVGSHAKAVAAWEAGKFDAEVVPVDVPQRKGDPVPMTRDEGPRADASLEGMGKLRPAFKRTDGTVTPGNASSINDGASAVVVVSEAKLKELGVEPLARVTGYATGGVEPKWVMMAPVDAARRLEKKLGKATTDYDLYELNEAFSAAACAVSKELEMDPERTNVHGGAVALGHPIGASGTRILTTLIHAMRDRGVDHGLANLCLGGGNAVALGVERC